VRSCPGRADHDPARRQSYIALGCMSSAPHRLRRDSFVHNVLVLMGGTTVAQAIPLVVSPILTRLYTPKEFGVYAEYVAIVSILAVAATGRYELAVMLPHEDDDAINVVASAIVASLLTSILAMLVFAAFNEWWTALLGVPEISRWLYFVPLTIFPMGAYQTLTYWLNRKQQYRRLAANDVALKAVLEGGKWLLGRGVTGGALGNGLIAATVASQVVAAGAVGCQVWRDRRGSVPTVSVGKVWSSMRAYRKFPVFNVPYSLLGIFSAQFVIFALTAFQHVHVAGFLSLTRRIVVGPINFLSASLGRVFFKETAVSIGKPRFEQLTVGLMMTIAELFTPAFGFFAFWAASVFGLVFGDDWVEAGRYASVLVPMAFCSLFTTWPERVFEVSQKQQVSFTIQIVFDAALVFLVWMGLQAGAEPLLVVAAYSGVSCAYHVTYLVGIFAVAGFSRTGLVRIGRRVVFLGAATAGLIITLWLAVPVPLYQFLIGGLLVGAYSVRVVAGVVGASRRARISLPV
jgi:lipopolysaccharide exporter